MPSSSAKAIAGYMLGAELSGSGRTDKNQAKV